MDHPKVSIPTAGRIIHYYPHLDTGGQPGPEHDVQTNGNRKGPITGIVTRAWGTDTLVINVTLFPDSAPPAFRGSVTHACKRIETTSGQCNSFWCYATEKPEDFPVEKSENLF